MKLSYQKDGVIQLSLAEGVAIPIPLSFFQEFITVLGGTLTLPAGIVSDPTLLNVYLHPSTTPHKIQFIKELRQVFTEVLAPAVSNEGHVLGLKAAKDFVEGALAGGTPLIFRGESHHATAICQKLNSMGWGCYTNVP